MATRIYNPSRGTFHPKIYLGRHGAIARAFIGSPNMTSGLVGNIEAGLAVEGLRMGLGGPALGGPSGWSLLAPVLERSPKFKTLSRGMTNTVSRFGNAGLFIKTDHSGAAEEFVPAWMFNVAWGFLRVRGELTNQYLREELRVHRSSAICAVLARLPGVEVDPDRGLRWGSRR